MSGLAIALSFLLIIVCCALVTMILMQKKRTSGLGGIAGMGASQTYWDKNKGRTLEGTLELHSKIGGGLLFVLSAVLCIIQ